MKGPQSLERGRIGICMSIVMSMAVKIPLKGRGDFDSVQIKTSSLPVNCK